MWEAQDETLGRPVAVKLISLLAGGGSRGDEARARFLREARITAQLQHPNIVTIHDFGETGTGDSRVPFLVMELVRGEGLDAMLRKGAVTLQDAARWGVQICDALADAHEAGIMHRDIKPSNILITTSGVVKVLDFGVARAADPYATADRLTRTGFIVGTPPYMAPEQARGLPEPRSDLYALGCILFELITGQLPFQAPDALGYLSAHLTQEPPTPSSVSTDIPPAWDDLVLTLLHKDPTQRYPNAASLSQALRQLDRTHVPTTAGPIRVPARPSRPESRAPEPDRSPPVGPGRSDAAGSVSDSAAGYLFTGSPVPRVMAAFWGLVTLALGLVVLGFSAPQLAKHVFPAIGGAVLIGCAALLLRRGLARRDRLQVDPSGVRAQSRAFRATITWDRIARIGLVRIHSRHFVVAWLADGTSLPPGMPRQAAFSGGCVIYTLPPARGTNRELFASEVRGALIQHSGGRFDPAA